MPPTFTPIGGVQAVPFTGSNAGQLMHDHSITAPRRRQLHVVPA
jgi:hypothetical protein